MNRAFADSFYFFAILNPRDPAHRRARDFSEGAPIRFVTTAWVLTEVADGLATTPKREQFGKILADLRGEPLATIIPASETLFDEGVELYLQRLDKGWSLTDCISFIVMRQRGLSDALTGDHHFEQAGFKALLR